MRSPALAIAWEFHQGHRIGLIALAAYVLFVGTIRHLILGPDQPIRLDPPNGFAALVIAPFSIMFLYFLAVFSFGLAGDLAGRPSIYPARMFTLPVKAAALAGWPMLYGAAAMTSLWLATALVAGWGSGSDVPLIWPALLAAVFLAWTQVFTWMPYGLPGLRVIVTVLWLVTLDAVVFTAVHNQVSERLMVAFLAPQLPLAFLAAWFAVKRARRGHVPDWRGPFARSRDIADVRARRDHFPTPARAQLWFEWRRHGRTLPALVAILLPFELALISVAPGLLYSILVCVLLTPPFMAAFVGATVSKANPHARDYAGVTPFIATRPLTSAALIAAKLQMAIWSTLATWLLVLVAVPVGLILTGTWPLVIDRASRVIEAIGTPRAIVLALLAFVGLVVTTWSQLVQSLYIGLTGREWIMKTSMFVSLSLLIVIGPVFQWIHDNGRAKAALWDAVPWIPTVLVLFKMAAAAWIAIRLYRSRLLSDRTLVTGAASWLIVVLALYGVLVWFIATPLIPRYFLASIAILAIPLARVSAAPLALAWNRHR